MGSIRSEAQRLKKFYSKRNQVHLCTDGGSEFIIKEFMDLTHYHTERRIYRKLQGLGLSPQMIDWSDERQMLELSYVEGTTVLEMLESYENDGQVEEAVILIEKVLVWLERFYQSVHSEHGQMVYHDINLRNFIVCDGKISGIDFECCDYGDLHYELVKVVAMYLRYDPVNSDYKKSVTNRLYERYYKQRDYSSIEFQGMIDQETEKILLRRQKK